MGGGLLVSVGGAEYGGALPVLGGPSVPLNREAEPHSLVDQKALSENGRRDLLMPHECREGPHTANQPHCLHQPRKGLWRYEMCIETLILIAPSLHCLTAGSEQTSARGHSRRAQSTAQRQGGAVLGIPRRSLL